MSDDYLNELGPAEREAFRSLTETGPCSKKLEDRIAKALRKQGLVTPSGPSPWTRIGRFGGMAIALVAAFWLGTRFGNQEREEPLPVAAPVIEYESLPDETMITAAFHLNLDDPIASGAFDNGQDLYGVPGKTLNP